MTDMADLDASNDRATPSLRDVARRTRSAPPATSPRQKKFSSIPSGPCGWAKIVALFDAFWRSAAGKGRGTAFFWWDRHSTRMPSYRLFDNLVDRRRREDGPSAGGRISEDFRYLPAIKNRRPSTSLRADERVVATDASACIVVHPHASWRTGRCDLDKQSQSEAGTTRRRRNCWPRINADDADECEFNF